MRRCRYGIQCLEAVQEVQEVLWWRCRRHHMMPPLSAAKQHSCRRLATALHPPLRSALQHPHTATPHTHPTQYHIPDAGASAAGPRFPVNMGPKAALVSNWTDAYREVDLPGCRAALHLPVLDPAALGLYHSLCIIFRPKINRVGMLCSCHNKRTMEALHRSPILGGSITGAFPGA